MSGYAASAFGPTNSLEEGSVLLKKPLGENDLLKQVRTALSQGSALTRNPLKVREPMPFERRKALRSRSTERGLPPEAQGGSDPHEPE
jgi:hypothetical protein